MSMARVKVKVLGEGQHPSEVVVAIQTSDGKVEETIVDCRSIEENTIDIGYPIGKDGNIYLVELPREAFNGSWRVWVKDSDISW
jgi:hypothetical protein